MRAWPNAATAARMREAASRAAARASVSRLGKTETRMPVGRKYFTKVQHPFTLADRGGSMGNRVDDAALDTLFREARSYMKWQSRAVSDETLHDLYELLKWAPTSA